MSEFEVTVHRERVVEEGGLREKPKTKDSKPKETTTPNDPHEREIQAIMAEFDAAAAAEATAPQPATNKDEVQSASLVESTEEPELPPPDGKEPPKTVVEPATEQDPAGEKSVVQSIEISGDDRLPALDSAVEHSEHTPQNLAQRIASCFREHEFLGQIGAGGFCKVFGLTEKATGNEFVFKVPHQDTSANRNRIQCEAALMQRLSTVCPDHFYPAQFVKDYDNGVVGILVNRAPDQLFTYLERASVTEKLKLFLQVTQAIAVMHEHGYYHGDIKFSTFGVENGLAKMLDLNSLKLGAQEIMELRGADASILQSGSMEHGAAKSLAPQNFRAPEQFERDESGELKLFASTDVWYLGRMLYQILLNRRAVGVVSPLEDGAEGAFSRFNAVIRKAVHDHHDQRFQTVNEFSEAVRSIIQQLGIDKEPTTSEPIAKSGWLQSLGSIFKTKEPDKLAQYSKREIRRSIEDLSSSSPDTSKAAEDFLRGTRIGWVQRALCDTLLSTPEIKVKQAASRCLAGVLLDGTALRLCEGGLNAEVPYTEPIVRALLQGTNSYAAAKWIVRNQPTSLYLLDGTSNVRTLRLVARKFVNGLLGPGFPRRVDKRIVSENEIHFKDMLNALRGPIGGKTLDLLTGTKDPKILRLLERRALRRTLEFDDDVEKIVLQTDWGLVRCICNMIGANASDRFLRTIVARAFKDLANGGPGPNSLVSLFADRVPSWLLKLARNAKSNERPAFLAMLERTTCREAMATLVVSGYDVSHIAKYVGHNMGIQLLIKAGTFLPYEIVPKEILKIAQNKGDLSGTRSRIAAIALMTGTQDPEAVTWLSGPGLKDADPEVVNACAVALSKT